MKSPSVEEFLCKFSLFLLHPFHSLQSKHRFMLSKSNATLVLANLEPCITYEDIFEIAFFIMKKMLYETTAEFIPTYLVIHHYFVQYENQEN